MRLRTLIVGLAAATSLLIAAAPAAAQSVQLVPFGGQTFNQPFYVTGAPGDPSQVFVDEARGTIRLIKNGVTQPTPFLDISSDVYRGSGCYYSDCGLFSMALAPDYATSGLFYVFYTRAPTGTEAFDLRIEEFRRSADPDVADPASGRIVLEIPRENLPGGGTPTAGHNAGQLQFGPDGLLYISVGDGDCCADPAGNGQNTAVLDGKLLRIDPTGTSPGEYSIPADNPFAGATPGRDEIYAYGLRNPYRFSFDRLTGDLTLGDVGEGAWEEVDFMPRGTGLGANFGWDCFEGNHVFFLAPSSCTSSPPANPTPPVLEYAHSTNPRGPASVMGGYVIRDGGLPSLLGRYIYADTFNTLGGQLHTAQLSAGSSSGDSALGVSASHVVSFGEDACAHIYVASIDGPVYRLEPTSGPFPLLAATAPERQQRLSGRRRHRSLSRCADAGLLQQGHGQGRHPGRLLAEANQRRGAGERQLRLVRPRRADLQARRRPGTRDAVHGEHLDRRQGPRRESAGGREDLAVHDGDSSGRQQRLPADGATEVSRVR